MGVDIASARRLAAALARSPRLAERVFTSAERALCAGQPRRWAARWAAKEAVRKLYGSSGRPLPPWLAIEVVSQPGGSPAVLVGGRPQGLSLSLSHEGDLAVAVVVGTLPPHPLAPPPEGLVLPPRPEDAHKGRFGTVVVVGGAVGYSGAPLMAALGAARGGAGRIRLCVPEQIYLAVAAQTLEVMAHPLPGADGGLAEAALGPLREQHLRAADAMVLGPGLGRSPGTERFLLDLLAELSCAAVIDADGLNIAADHEVRWSRGGAPVVITPHPAEMARLCRLDVARVQERRRQLAGEYARDQQVVVVLKGSETVVAAPDGRLHTCAVRTVALATGGSGDVLAGLLGAFLAQGLEPFSAAVAAVQVHAEAGLGLELAIGRAGALPRDLLEELPRAQQRLRNVLDARGG